MRSMSEPGASPALASIRVVLADDHDILRQGLKMLLSLQPEIEVVGEARTGGEAVKQALELHPQVVVLDISMPDMDGLEGLQADSRSRTHNQCADSHYARE